MATKLEILDAALEVLRHGDALTLDAVARHAGLTKPGLVHHFATKEGLTVAVVDRVIDLWEAELRERVSDESDEVERLRAYVEFSLLDDLDPSALALLAAARLRDKLSDQWMRRLDPWFGSGLYDPRVRSVRLLADGAWFDRSLGIVELSRAQRESMLSVALGLISEGVQK